MRASPARMRALRTLIGSRRRSWLVPDPGVHPPDGARYWWDAPDAPRLRYVIRALVAAPMAVVFGRRPRPIPLARWAEHAAATDFMRWELDLMRWELELA